MLSFNIHCFFFLHIKSDLLWALTSVCPDHNVTVWEDKQHMFGNSCWADSSSSADTSAGSNQRRKLTAPPLNVSLDRSEGSVLSEDALETEDEALDTGDDLDVNIDDMDTPDEAESLEFNIHG